MTGLCEKYSSKDMRTTKIALKRRLPKSADQNKTTSEKIL
jgi:hypothetical protein